MRIAIIGAGFSGLAAAYELAKNKHEVTVFEHAAYVGGLGAGFKNNVNDYPPHWEWDLERYYHHWFTNDYHILQLIDDIGYGDDIMTIRPITASWYDGKAYQIDSPLSLLQFPHLSLTNRLRTGIALALLKSIPRGMFLERWTTHDVLPLLTGRKSYEVLWGPLMRGKFDNYHKDINLAWFWARIYKRTPSLAYFKGGFQRVANLIAEAVTSIGGVIRLNASIQKVESKNATWQLTYTKDNVQKIEDFDRVIVTIPFPAFMSLFPQLPDDYKNQYSTRLNGIGAHTLILVLKESFLPNNTYWLNIHEADWPFLVIAEHTHLVDPSYYGGDTIIYIGDYLDPQNPLMQKDKHELLQIVLPYLQRINPDFSEEKIKKSWLWRTPYAQPIVSVDHSKHIPPLTTPLPGVFLANMSQVYPWDRGTNYAVELGQAAANLAAK